MKTTPIIAFLEAIYSERDLNGNTYWALRFTDCATGAVVCGTVCGGESNIYSILRYWGPADDWNRGIKFSVVPMKKREFQRLTKGWSYAGCTGEDLTQYIKENLP